MFCISSGKPSLNATKNLEKTRGEVIRRLWTKNGQEDWGKRTRTAKWSGGEFPGLFVNFLPDFPAWTKQQAESQSCGCGREKDHQEKLSLSGLRSENRRKHLVCFLPPSLPPLLPYFFFPLKTSSKPQFQTSWAEAKKEQQWWLGGHLKLWDGHAFSLARVTAICRVEGETHLFSFLYISSHCLKEEGAPAAGSVQLSEETEYLVFKLKSQKEPFGCQRVLGDWEERVQERMKWR